MPIYLGEETRHDGRYGTEFEADSWADAEAHCATRGWTLVGTLEVIIDAETLETTYDRQAAERSVSAMLEKASGRGT